MAALLYYISIPWLYLISWLPFWALYLLSDGIRVLLFGLIGYRKKVVLTNLCNSFPEKSEAEIQTIARQFYRNFCDLVLETLKTLTIGPAALKKHVLFEDRSVFQQYFDQGKSVIVVMGHVGNWELGGARFALEPIHPLYVIYHPLHNPYFDRLVYHMRTRMGNRLYAMKDTIRSMMANRDQVTATAFIADQTPSPQSAYWTTFLNQDTPIFTGTEKLARKLGFPVIYVSLRRVKRGLYAIEPEVLIEDPKATAPNEISEMHTRRLEQDIIAYPDTWLWTHRRWKHKKP